MIEVGLYVHIPFCPTKCGYCDFYSAVPEPGILTPFVDALLIELAHALDADDVRIETIFVGGGTPTHLPEVLLGKLFDELGRLATEHRVAEFSVETNPGSLDESKARLLHACGVNRISMGAQSFHAVELAVLQRSHVREQIVAGAELVNRLGFDHFNLDLIFGIPGQTMLSWQDSLKQAVAIGADHLACYGLTFEPGTPLERRRREGLVEPMAETLEAQLYQFAIESLAGVGFEQYEISNFARPDGQCRHNLRYWHNLPTLGIGPAAASYVGGRRWRNVPDTREYIDLIGSRESTAIDVEILSPTENAGETAMLMLRLVEGIDCARFRALTGFDPLALFAEPIGRYRSAGLLTADAGHIALTSRGRLVADTVFTDFLRPEPI